MRVGDWDVAIACLGGQGCGKSTYAKQRVRQMMAERALYVVAHDPTMGAVGADVHRHRSEEQLLAGLGTSPSGMHCLDVADGLRVVKCALRVAASARKQADPTPTLVVLDEIVTVGNMSPSYLDPTVAEGYALRRHKHLGWLFCSQRQQQVHPTIRELATELVVFRATTDRQIASLEELGVPPATLDQVRALPYFIHPKHTGPLPDRIPSGAPTSRDLRACYVIFRK